MSTEVVLVALLEIVSVGVRAVYSFGGVPQIGSDSGADAFVCLQEQGAH
jgi:hypothetical protein